MALINNIYVLAEKEDFNNDVETVTHPVESSDIPTASDVKKQPVSLNISGKIANNENLTAKQTVDKLKKLQNSGSLITYVGEVGTIKNLQIQSFNPSYHNKNYGGADFSMTLKEIRVAKSAYVAPNTTLFKKIVTTPKSIAVGNTVKFLGGYVYVSSDASKPASKRGASTCRVTRISPLPNAKHKYHLVSKDCKWGSSNYVYGWVDADRIKGNTSTTAGSTNGGTQQVQETAKDVIYHTVKKGETIWGLVNRTYKSKGFSVSKVIKDNPTAFSNTNLPSTLRIGARLKLSK